MVIPDPTTPTFTISGETLLVTGDLHAAAEDQFRDAMRELLASGVESPVIDITGVQYRGSSYVRLIAMAMMQAKDEGHSLTVRAAERTVRILEMGGLAKLGNIVAVLDA